MGIGSAAGTPYGNGDQLVSDMIGPAYRTVKLVAEHITDIEFINANRVAILAAGEMVSQNLPLITGAVVASENAVLAASNAASSEASVMTSIDTVLQAVLDAESAAAEAAASALLLDNAVTGNYLDKTGGTVTGNINVTGFVTTAQNPYSVSWDQSFAVPTRHDVRGAIEALRNTVVGNVLVGAANGVAPTGADNKIPMAFLPDAILGGLKFIGFWNGSNNTPELPAPSAANKGQYYMVSVAGAANINNQNEWEVGDWIVSNGLTWTKIDNTDRITSVNGKRGAVILDRTDIGLSNVDNTSDNNKPISYPTAQALSGKAPFYPRHSLPNSNILTPTFQEDLISRLVNGHVNIQNYAGNPSSGWGLVLQLVCDANSWSIVWGSQYRAVGVSTLPVAMVPNKTMYIGMIFNGFIDKFDVMSVVVEP